MGLTKEGVLEAAVALADEVGGGAPSMRALAKRLGVEAMSLYHHFRNKDLILDGMVDRVFSEIALPPEDLEWRAAVRVRGDSMREVLNRHPWAIGLMDSRTNPGWATLRHHDAMIGCFRAAGFTVAGAAHAVSVVDAYLYGFVLQELSLPFKGDEVVDVAGGILDGLPEDEFPHLAELIVEHAMKPGYDHTAEFAIGFDLVLDGLERHRERW